MVSKEEKKSKRTIKFLAFFILGVCLIWFVRLLFSNGNPFVFDVARTDVGKGNNVDNIIPAQQRNLLLQDEVLHSYLSSLQNFDAEYISILSGGNVVNNTALLNVKNNILLTEIAFNKSIDSVASAMIKYPNKVDENLFLNMISSFRLALQNRRAINNVRNMLEEKNENLNPDQKILFTIKNELVAKDTKIASLETALKLMQNSVALTAAANNNTTNEQFEINKKLLERDNKITTLTTLSNTLQKQNERLNKQVIDGVKATESNEYALKAKTTVLEKKIEDLNAEIRLAQVDCNLVRADASQIISNSKQRKLLLSEAINILNGLAKTENGAMQKKIQDKITKLNQVATTYRD